MKIQRFTELKNIDRLSKIIFFNFIELQNEQGIEFSIEDITSTLNSPSLLGWFLLDNNDKIIGYLIGTIKEIGDGRVAYYISYFYIIQKYRNNGIGKKMLAISINYIKKINIKFIMLISKKNSNAWNMYRKFGFSEDPIVKINNNRYALLLYYCF